MPPTVDSEPVVVVPDEPVLVVVPDEPVLVVRDVPDNFEPVVLDPQLAERDLSEVSV